MSRELDSLEAELNRRVNPEKSRIFNADRLEASQAILERLLEHPALGQPSGGRRFSLVGSNGKGSTAFYLAHIARADAAEQAREQASESQPTAVALFTSPHLRSVLERIRVNGRPVSPRAALAGMHTVREIAGDDWEHLSYFELTLLIACAVFHTRGCATQIFEAGLGGRWDATRAVRARHIFLLPIELEHVNVLGDTLEAILAEKAAILTEDSESLDVFPQPNLSQEQVRAAVRRFAPDLPDLHFYEPPAATVSDPEDYLTKNFHFARSCWRRITGRDPSIPEPPPAPPGRLEERRTRLPNRQGARVTLFFDPAHNAPAFPVSLAALMSRGYSASKTLVLLGLLPDRDASAALKTIGEAGYECRLLTADFLGPPPPGEEDAALPLDDLPRRLDTLLRQGQFRACLFLGTHRTHSDFRRTWRALRRG